MPAARRLAAGLAAAALLAVAGCASSRSGTVAAGSPIAQVSTPAPSPGTLHGAVLDTPLPEPDIALTDTTGKPFDLKAQTRGELVLLYFGYTHCPDACPTQMADLASALTEVVPAVRDKVRVVFVTTDPARDTGPVLRAWLDHFDTSLAKLPGGHRYVGLIGTSPQVRNAANAAHVDFEVENDNTGVNYTVVHGTQLMAFTPAGSAPEFFLAGSTPADIAADLPVLVSRT